MLGRRDVGKLTLSALPWMTLPRGLARSFVTFVRKQWSTTPDPGPACVLSSRCFRDLGRGNSHDAGSKNQQNQGLLRTFCES